MSFEDISRMPNEMLETYNWTITKKATEFYENLQAEKKELHCKTEKKAGEEENFRVGSALIHQQTTKKNIYKAHGERGKRVIETALSQKLIVL